MKLYEYIENKFFSSFELNEIRNILKQSFIPIFTLSIIYFYPFFNNDFVRYETSTWRSIGSIPDAAGIEVGRVFSETILSIFSFEFDWFKLFSHQSLIYTGTLNQIISIAALVFACIIFYYRINKDKLNIYSSIVVFSFLLNPFLLTTFSYQNESIIVCFSIAFAVLAAGINLESKFLSIFISTVLLFSSFCLYQTGFNVFCGALCFIFLVDFMNQTIKESFRNLAFNILKLIFASLSYKFIVLNNIVHGEYYKQCAIIDFKNAFSYFLRLFNEYFSLFLESRIIVLFSLVSLISFFILYIKSSKNKFLSILVFLLCLTGIIFFCFGFLTLLPGFVIYSPKYKVFAAFSILFMLIFYAYFQSSKHYFPKLNFLILIPVFYFFVLSYGYVAMQNSQFQLCERVANSVIDKLEGLGFNHKIDKVTFEGDIFASSVAQNSMKHNKILKKLYFPNFTGSWHTYIFINSMDLNTSFINFDKPNKDLLCKEMKALYKGKYFKISKTNDTFVVVFQGGPCFASLQ